MPRVGGKNPRRGTRDIPYRDRNLSRIPLSGGETTPPSSGGYSLSRVRRDMSRSRLQLRFSHFQTHTLPRGTSRDTNVPCRAGAEERAGHRPFLRCIRRPMSRARIRHDYAPFGLGEETRPNGSGEAAP